MRHVLALVVLLGCGRDKKPNEGLPPGEEWAQNSAGQMVQMGQKDLPPPAPPPGMANPHAGGNDPHAGMNINPSDPHAGLGIPPANAPHGAGSSDTGPMGLPAPDPNRQIDPSRYVKGVIKIHEKARARAKPGTPLFVFVKRAGSDGAPTGFALAADKLEWNAAGELTFTLTDAQAMVAGTELSGDVIVIARYDQDADASSKQPGDITGQTRATLPAENVTIVLDTIL